LATAFALVELLRFDLWILRNRNSTLTEQNLLRLNIARRTVTVALTVLWVTGLWLVIDGSLAADKYLANQKLWMKLFTVVLLTLNGVVMHRFGFSQMRPGCVLMRLPVRQQSVLLGMGVISSISWLFAAFLGIARLWNHTTGIGELTLIYLLLLVTGFIVAGLMLSRYMVRGEPAADKSAGAV
jgi:hypothetical protein